MIVEIKIATKPKGGNKKLLKKYESGLYKKLDKAFKSVYGSSVDLATVQRLHGRVDYNATGGKNPKSPHAKAIQDLYVDAWDSRYAQIKRKFEGTFDAEKRARHEYRKRRMIIKGKKTSYGRRVEYTSPALLSGYFRRTIAYGMDVGGSGKVKLGHLLLTGGYGVDLESAHFAHVNQFLDLLVRRGVQNNRLDMFKFSRGHEQKIAKFMRFILENELVPKWNQILKNSSKE